MVMETVSAGRFLLHKLQNGDLSGFAKFIIFLPVWAYCMFSQLLGIKLVKTAMQRFLHKEEIYTTWIKAKEYKAYSHQVNEQQEAPADVRNAENKSLSWSHFHHTTLP